MMTKYIEYVILFFMYRLSFVLCASKILDHNE